MTRFQASLEQIDASLALPQPQRGRVVAEIAADLEDLYGALRAEGLRAADAERRALALAMPDTEALRELERLHEPAYQRLVSRLTRRARMRLERAALGVLSLGVVGLTALALPVESLVRDPSPFLLPVIALGCAGLLVALVCALRLFVLGVATPTEAERGLDFILLFAAAGPFLAVIGLLIDFHLAAGRIMSDPEQSVAIVVRLLRVDGMLLVSALCFSLLSSFCWMLLHARLATVREASAALRFAARGPALVDDDRTRDVA